MSEQEIDDADDLAFKAWRNSVPFHELALSKAWHASRAGLRAELAALRAACSKENDEICQVLGKALHCPWFKDDQEHFPGATAANGVFVGDDVAMTMAIQTARQIDELRAAQPDPAMVRALAMFFAMVEVGDDSVYDVACKWGLLVSGQFPRELTDLGRAALAAAEAL